MFHFENGPVAPIPESFKEEVGLDDIAPDSSNRELEDTNSFILILIQRIIKSLRFESETEMS